MSLVPPFPVEASYREPWPLTRPKVTGAASVFPVTCPGLFRVLLGTFRTLRPGCSSKQPVKRPSLDARSRSQGRVVKFIPFDLRRGSTRCNGSLEKHGGWGCSQFTAAVHVVQQNWIYTELLRAEFGFFAWQKVRLHGRFTASFPGMLCGSSRAQILLVFCVAPEPGGRARDLHSGWSLRLLGGKRGGTQELGLGASWLGGPCGPLGRGLRLFVSRNNTFHRRLSRMVHVPGGFHYQSQEEAPLKAQTPSLGAGAVQFPQSHDHDPLGLCADLHVTACFEISPGQTITSQCFWIQSPPADFTHRHDTDRVQGNYLSPRWRHSPSVIRKSPAFWSAISNNWQQLWLF